MWHLAFHVLAACVGTDVKLARSGWSAACADPVLCSALTPGAVCGRQGTVPQATAEVLQRLVALWGLSSLVREAGDFLEDGYFTGQQVCSAMLPSSCHCFGVSHKGCLYL